MLNNITNFYKNNKFKIIVACVFIIVIFAVFIPVSFSIKGKEQKIGNRFKELVADFYENTYYNQIGNDDGTRLSFLSKYVSTGIKINLENLARTKDNQGEILKEFNGCNKENTKATIYPKEPLGKKDYTIEVELDCGFN